MRPACAERSGSSIEKIAPLFSRDVVEVARCNRDDKRNKIATKRRDRAVEAVDKARDWRARQASLINSN